MIRIPSRELSKVFLTKLKSLDFGNYKLTTFENVGGVLKMWFERDMIKRLAQVYVATKVNGNKKDSIIRNSKDPLVISAALTSEFTQGVGPEKRIFDENHPLTKSLKESNMTTIALKQFFNGYVQYLKGRAGLGASRDMPKYYAMDFKLWNDKNNTGLIKEFVKDKKFTTAQFIGSAKYYFDFDEQEKILKIKVEDDKNHNSLFLHISDKKYPRSERKEYGNTYQVYNFSLTLDEIINRIR